MPPTSGTLSSGTALTGLVSLLLTCSRAQGVTLPSAAAVDLVLPRNDTYNPARTFPVVFALQGASAAWTFGFFLDWRVRRAEGCQGECGIVGAGRLSVDQGQLGSVSFGPDDYYLYKDQTTALSEDWGLGVAAGGFQGAYRLEWDFGFIRNCSGAGGATQSEGGITDFSGTAIFSVVPGASPDVRKQLEDCPVPGGAVVVEADLDGCPVLSSTGADADPCVVKVPDDVVSSVVAQMAAGGSPDQPGAPPIPGVPLPGGPPGATTVIGYPGGGGGGPEATSSPERPATTARTPAPSIPIPPAPTTASSFNTTSGVGPTPSASRQTTAAPTVVVVNASANIRGSLYQAVLVIMLSALGAYVL